MSSGYFPSHCPHCSQIEGKPVFTVISYWAKHPFDNVPLFDVCTQCGYAVTTNIKKETVYGQTAAKIILETHNDYTEVNANTINELLGAVVARSVFEKLELGYKHQENLPINTVEDVILNAGFPFNADPSSCADLDEILT